MPLCEQMIEMLRMKTFFLYAFADLKYSLDCFSFCCPQNAGDGFPQLNDYYRMMVHAYAALVFSDLD